MPRRKRGADDVRGTIRRLMGYIWGAHKLRFIIVFVCIFLSAAANVSGSLFLEPLIDDYITPLIAMEQPVFTGLIKALFMLAMIYLTGVLASLAYNWLMVTIGQRVQKEIRDRLFSHMQKLPLRYFDSHTHGNIMSHFTNDIDALRQMLTMSIPQIISSIVTIVAVFCAMLYISLPLTGMILLLVTGMLYVTGQISGKSAQYFVAQQYDLAAVNGYIEEMINGQKVVKVFCHEEEAKSGFDELNEKLCRSATEANRYANILMPVMANLGNLQYVLVAIVGGAMAVFGVGGMSLGAIATFLLLTRSFHMPLGQVSQQLNAIIMALAGAERIFKLMDEPAESDEGTVTLVNAKYENGALTETSERSRLWAWKQPQDDGRFVYTRLSGDVRFFNVNFAYKPEEPVLRDVSLYAKPGEKVAFVGATGAGKTTITNLINRFYDIQEGRITYDGINIKEIEKSALRRSLGVVLQDTHLFTGTIRENIRYGRLEATDEEVYAAARLANADGFIQMLPDGYDTVLSGNGTDLSQGQRQLLSIARAAVADPPVMILDEATSSIDTRTEMIVQRGMDSLMEGRTVFVIAHRLSTIKNAKAIMVLEHGVIIERGDHEFLLAEKGKYYQLHEGGLELE